MDKNKLSGLTKSCLATRACGYSPSTFAAVASIRSEGYFALRAAYSKVQRGFPKNLGFNSKNVGASM